MTDMRDWTSEEKREYIPFLEAILSDVFMSEQATRDLSPRVRTAVRDLLRPDR